MTSRDRIVRMTCSTRPGGHRRLYRLPEDAVIDWMGVASWVYGGPERPEAGGYGHGPREYLRCSEDGCNRAMRAVVIEGRYSDRIKCGPRCQSAIGPSCECACGGENHGT